MNLPTKITVFRIFLVPVLWVVLLLPNIMGDYQKIIALIIFVVASISDFLDGYIARKYNMITSLGKFLDPIADKVLVNSLLIYLAYTNTIPLICVLLMITRDTLVDAMRMNASEKGIVVSAKFLGKLKTVMQMVTITVALINQSIIVEILVWIATIISLWSGLDYFSALKKEIF